MNIIVSLRNCLKPILLFILVILIPIDTDILITHNPPYGILDFDDGINYGSEKLLEKLTTLNLKAHLFGHIHSSHGEETINGITFSNGSILNSNYIEHYHPNILIIK